jgi:riboflavin kinase / FMN adenylyltransferase
MINIKGRVIKGDGYGRKIGFPTTNLDRRQYKREGMKIKLGVWAGTAELVRSNKKQVTSNWKAAIVIGPVDKSGLPKIEAHLMGFKGNLYGKYLNIYLNKYLRPFRKFKSEKELIIQIKKDIKKIKFLLLLQ